MKNFKTINLGLDEMAQIYIDVNADKEKKPVIINRLGILKSIELKQYKLKDGTIAQEYVQFAHVTEIDQTVYFIGLRTKKRNFDWPTEKINKKINRYEKHG